jgi:hypothetical protein
MRALDFFAGDGTLLSSRLLQGYEVEAWDQRAEALNRYVFPDAVKRCGDSFELSRETKSRFNLILIDNPAGCFRGCCEHFEALESALPLLRDEATIIFNLFTSPLRYLVWQPLNGGSLRNSFRRYLNGELAQWNRKRLEYYQLNLIFLEEFIAFYNQLFKARGFTVKNYEVEKRGFGVYLASFNLRRGI